MRRRPPRARGARCARAHAPTLRPVREPPQPRSRPTIVRRAPRDRLARLRGRAAQARRGRSGDRRPSRAAPAPRGRVARPSAVRPRSSSSSASSSSVTPCHQVNSEPAASSALRASSRAARSWSPVGTRDPGEELGRDRLPAHEPGLVDQARGLLGQLHARGRSRPGRARPARAGRARSRRRAGRGCGGTGRAQARRCGDRSARSPAITEAAP